METLRLVKVQYHPTEWFNEGRSWQPFPDHKTNTRRNRLVLNSHNEITISISLVKENNSDSEPKVSTDKVPTKWFKNEQIETWIGETYNGEKPLEEVNGGRAKLIVMHQCPNKELLIEQLKTMINNIETDGEYFAS